MKLKLSSTIGISKLVFARALLSILDVLASRLCAPESELQTPAYRATKTIRQNLREHHIVISIEIKRPKNQ
jgi:hypothetical protein